MKIIFQTQTFINLSCRIIFGDENYFTEVNFCNVKLQKYFENGNYFLNFVTLI